MLSTTIIPSAVLGASAQINITNLYTTTNTTVTPVVPAVDANVQRFTANSVTINATIQNIGDSEIIDIYYEVENFNTGAKSTIKTNKASHVSGSSDIVFANVILTEGLNKITIKLGGSSVISSAPGWAYFTATTNISNLTINNAPFDDTKIYPETPALGSTLTIKGDALNATSVQTFVEGNSTPKNAFLNNSSFFFTADDESKNNTAASFGLKAGDNLLTLVSKNSTKSYQTQRNLIYDNGKPFAFNAKIQAEDVNKLPVGPTKNLISIPTITSQNAQISAQLKSDLAGTSANSPIKYRYVDVVVNGQVSGTYDLQGATTATRAYSVSPAQFVIGHADTTITITGTGLDSPSLSVALEDKAAVSTPLAASNAAPFISTDKQTIQYKLPAGSIASGSPYKLVVKDGPVVLNTFTITAVAETTPIASLTTSITFPAISLKEGYSASAQTVTFPAGTTPTASAVTIDILNFNGQGAPLASYTGTGTTNVIAFSVLPGLMQGNYKMRVSYGGNALAERTFSISKADPIAPLVNTPSGPAVAASFAGVPSSPAAAPFYFAVTGTNLATKVGDISSIAITQDTTAGPQAAVSSGDLSLSDPKATNIKYVVNAARTVAATVKSSGTAFTTPLTAALPIANGDHLSVVSLDGSSNIVGYNDFIVTVASGAITAAAVQNVAGAGPAAQPTVYAAQGTSIIFQINNPSDPFYEDGVIYKLAFSQQTRYSDGTAAGVVAVPAVPGVLRSNKLFGQALYTNQFVTNITPLQIQNSPAQGSTNIVLTGANLTPVAKLVVKIINEDGTAVGAGQAAITASASGASAVVNLPTGLTVGNYMLQVVYDGAHILTQYPFVLSNPVMTTISPVAGSSANGAITVFGTGLGRDESLLKLKYTLDSNPSFIIPIQSIIPGTLETGSKAQFPVPSNLPQGNYTVTLSYNNTPVGTQSYTVNSAPTILKENSAMSKAGSYKVFDFKTDLTLSASKIQTVQFQFYNVAPDKVGLQPRLFLFNYVDPSLPYVDYVSKGSRVVPSTDFPLSLTSGNEINELPEWFNVYTDKNTNKVNIYFGDYTSNTPIYKTMINTNAGTATPPAAPPGADYTVTSTASSLAGGTSAITASPSLTAGSYDLTITGTSVWAAGDQIVIDNSTFTATNGVTSSTNFNLGPNTPADIATNLTTSLGFNPALTARYTITNPSAGVIRFVQKSGYETNVPLTVSDSSAAGTAVVSTNTAYVSTTKGVFTSTITGSAVGADSITVSLTGGALTANITSDSIPVKGKTLDQVASAIASKLTQIGVNGYTVTNASGTNTVVFSQNYAFTAPAIVLTINGGYNIYSFKILGLANGPTKLTAVPSINKVLSPVSSGENLAGMRTYDLNVLSAPYVILNNIYNGMILKDDPNTSLVENQTNLIACLSGSTPLDSCISGRLVNVPANEYANVEVSINNVKSNLRNPLVPTAATTDFDDLAIGKFHFQFGSNAGPAERKSPLTEGKNTIKFAIYGNGQLLTESVYEVFVFTNSAPSFPSLKPDESLTNANVTKFVPASVADSYSTSETNVSFVGQFVNVDDIKLTVKSTDATGQPISSYDRRFGFGFGTPDPQNGNPNYLSLAGQVNGNFRTNPIPLAKKGNTVFEFTITNSTKVTIVRTITITREPLPYRIIFPAFTLNAKKETQANINSNFVEIELEAEGADKVSFGKDDATARQVLDSNNNTVTHYFYEVQNLKTGANKVNFTVTRGKQVLPGSVVLFNVDTPIEGAQYKTVMKTKLKAFNGEAELSFPAGTNLIRNDSTIVNQFISTNRSILFGIANQDDGRVDKYKHPSASDGQIGNPNTLIPPAAPLLLSEPTHRFRPASKLLWIDAGTISANETDLNKALNGSGRDPYDTTDALFYSRGIKDLVVPTKRGTLTLKYDSNIRDESWKYLTVYHYDIYEDYTGSTQYRWKNVGGVVDRAKDTVTVPFDNFGYYQVMYMDKSFDDVIGHSWARNQLDTLYAKGLMVNKDAANFIPNDPIGRGEFTSLIVKIFDIPIQYTSTPTFSDVLRVNPTTNGLYDYMTIESAAKAGVVRGSGGGVFGPTQTITRQDAASMIARAANLKLSTDPDKSLVNLQKLFTDANSIDTYARVSVEAVTKAGLINGKPNVLLQGQKKTTLRFDPNETLTRAEASEVAIQVLKLLKKFPK
jgi:hypothetical protein